MADRSGRLSKPRPAFHQLAVRGFVQWFVCHRPFVNLDGLTELACIHQDGTGRTEGHFVIETKFASAFLRPCTKGYAVKEVPCVDADRFLQMRQGLRAREASGEAQSALEIGDVITVLARLVEAVLTPVERYPVAVAQGTSQVPHRTVQSISQLLVAQLRPKGEAQLEPGPGRRATNEGKKARVV